MFARFLEFFELAEFKLFEFFYKNITVIFEPHSREEFVGFRGIFLIIGVRVIRI